MESASDRAMDQKLFHGSWCQAQSFSFPFLAKICYPQRNISFRLEISNSTGVHTPVNLFEIFAQKAIPRPVCMSEVEHVEHEGDHLPFFSRWDSKEAVLQIFGDLQKHQLAFPTRHLPPLEGYSPCTRHDVYLPKPQCQMPLSPHDIGLPVFQHFGTGFENFKNEGSLVVGRNGALKNAFRRRSATNCSICWPRLQKMASKFTKRKTFHCRPFWNSLPPTLIYPHCLPSGTTANLIGQGEPPEISEILLTDFADGPLACRLNPTNGGHAGTSSYLLENFLRPMIPKGLGNKSIRAGGPQSPDIRPLTQILASLPETEVRDVATDSFGYLTKFDYDKPERKLYAFGCSKISRRGDVYPQKYVAQDELESQPPDNLANGATEQPRSLSRNTKYLEMFDWDSNVAGSQILASESAVPNIALDFCEKNEGPENAESREEEPAISSRTQPGNENKGNDSTTGNAVIRKEAEQKEPLHAECTPGNIRNVQKDKADGWGFCPESVSVPTSLIISKHAVETAETCLQKRRTFVILPPPLSIMPSLAALVNTFIQEKASNNRILIVCLGLVPREVADVKIFLASVLGTRHILDDSEISRDCGGEGLEGSSCLIVSPNLARLVADTGVVHYGMVAVLVQNGFSSHSGLSSLRRLQNMARSPFYTDKTRHIYPRSHVFVAAPYPACLDYEDTKAGLQILSPIFLLEFVIFRNPLIEHNLRASVEMARPSQFHIVLPPEAEEAVNFFEEISFTLVQNFWRSQEHQNDAMGIDDIVPPSLADLDISDVHRRLHNARALNNPHSTTTKSIVEDMIVLSVLKRGLIFAVNENVSRAIHFISQAASKYGNTIINDCKSKLEHILKSYGGVDNVAGESSSFHRVNYIKDLVKKEQIKFSREEKSTGASRLQKSWCCLVITESGKAADILLSLLDGADDVENLDKSSVVDGPQQFVAHLSQIETSARNQVSALKFFGNFSHIIHIPDSLSTQPMTSAPPPVEQLSQSNALRLIRVSVDISRRIEHNTADANKKFGKLCAILTKQPRAIPTKYVISALEDITMGNGPRPKTKGRLIALDIAVGVLARHSENSVASLLFAKIREIGPGGTLCLRVHVPLRTTIETTVALLHGVVISYGALREKVRVSYRMDHMRSCREDQEFIARKRIRRQHTESSLV